MVSDLVCLAWFSSLQQQHLGAKHGARIKTTDLCILFQIQLEQKCPCICFLVWWKNVANRGSLQSPKILLDPPRLKRLGSRSTFWVCSGYGERLHTLALNKMANSTSQSLRLQVGRKGFYFGWICTPHHLEIKI